MPLEHDSGTAGQEIYIERPNPDATGMERVYGKITKVEPIQDGRIYSISSDINESWSGASVFTVTDKLLGFVGADQKTPNRVIEAQLFCSKTSSLIVEYEQALIEDRIYRYRY